MRLVLALAACGAWTIAAASAPAAELSGVEVEGLRLGMTQGAVQDRYPYMHFREIPYVDDRVGDRYRVLHGSLVPLIIEGETVRERDGQTVAVDAVLTSQGRLFGAEARVEDDGMACRSIAEDMRTRYGEPTIDNGPGELAWVQKTLGAHVSLRFTCFDKGSYALKLLDHRMQEENLRTVRERLEPVILETLQRVQ